jgi:L-iditol 2-dehydrogenase
VRTSRAAVVTELGAPLEIHEVPVPELDEGALLVRIVASTLCGTDVHRWHGPLPKGDSVPYITGHEPCGIVEEIAGARRDILGAQVQVGDRIIWTYPSCGSCYYCTIARQPCLCRERASWGHHRSDEYPYLLGSVAEHMYVPARSHLVRVPDEVPSALAAAAACAFRTVVHGFERLGAILPNETVLVQGAGPLGCFAATMAKESGAARVLLTGAPGARLETARHLGADAVLDLEEVPEAADRVAWVRENTDGRGADVVIQAADARALAEGLSALRDGGRAVSIGVGGSAPIDAARLPGEMTLYTVRSGEPRHWLQALEFLSSRMARYPFEEMISASYPLEEVNTAMAQMANFEVVKAVITM